MGKGFKSIGKVVSNAFSSPGKAFATVATGGLAPLAGGAMGAMTPGSPKIKMPEGPNVTGPKPPKEYSAKELLSLRNKLGPGSAAGLVAPAFLNMPAGMSPLQARTHIATQAVGEGGGAWKSKEAFDYYRKLAYGSLIGDGGKFMSPSPIESQYLSEVFGENIASTPTGYLSAVERIYGGF